jgi:hypothetical protein
VIVIATLSVVVVKLLVVPFALDGDAATERTGSGEAIAVVSVVSIAAGYLLLYALWRYVFSEKAKLKRGEPPDRSDRG